MPTPQADRDRFCLADKDVLTLADYAIKIERHYSDKAGHLEPMDMEWAKDGLDRQLYIHSGICGQAPSDFPEFADYLVRLGIDSISLNPDCVVKTTLRVFEIEKSLAKTPAPAPAG